jgi:leucyl-tRNA synthetase
MLHENYNPQEIEIQTQKYWEDTQLFSVREDLTKEKLYCLSMFPYPSGQMHMGHVRNYAIGDVITRYQRMLGKNVMQPMGWDAFGLPAENAAIQKNIPPAKWTYENINHMKNQLKRLGFAYDWRRELTTCKPDYYRWEQWLFIKMYERGLAYRKSAILNWDPVDKTVLANEQVIDGRGWRSGALVERREITQWFLKITDYAEELLEDLNKLTHWPDEVKNMQRNWIGKSEGVSIQFVLLDDDETLEVFTTRADTLMGVTYLGIAPDHPLVNKLIQSGRATDAMLNFIEECKHIKVAEETLATLEKKGINTGLKARHPITNEELPIWIANFVVMDYGSGAVMSVPAHDQRDFEFAKKYNLPIKQVIKLSTDEQWDFNQGAFTEYGVLMNSGQFDGLDSTKAILAITEYLEEKKLGNKKIHYRLRDWGISRQRYWGCPIPMIYCNSCGIIPAPLKELPIVLPEDVDFSVTLSPLKSIPEFYETTCPHCHEPARRETDTFDTFMESSWYFARFACVNQNKEMLDDRAKYWLPVDYYIGGVEHAVMHLLYARFITKVLRDLGLLNSDEPFQHLLTQGMVLKDGMKMSKSKGNIVSPEDLIQQYGADTARVFTIFAAPIEQSLEWSDSGVEGCYRFLKRIWTFAFTHQDLIKLRFPDMQEFDWEHVPPEVTRLRQQVYSILKQARHDYDRNRFNTVVSACMKLLNLLTKEIADHLKSTDNIIREASTNLLIDGLSILLRLLSPIAPHITQVLWRELDFGDNILFAPWPKVYADALKVENIDIVVQINGKTRGKILVTPNADEEAIKNIVVHDEKLKNHFVGKTIKKVIVVPGKLANLVI